MTRSVAETLPRPPWSTAQAVRRWTAGLRRLPDFLVIGAQRAGTTSLAQALGLHPEVWMAPGKEIHYFDLQFERGERWYRSHFPLRAAGRHRAVGEATPYYLFHPTSAERAGALLPHARLVCLLRDPVERAWSHFNHERQSGHEPLEDFEAALDAEDERIADTSPEAHPGVTDIRRAHQWFSYAGRGDYAQQLAVWLRHFPREQLLVESSEDLFTDPTGVLARVAEHLGLERPLPSNLPHANRGSTRAMPEAARDRLQERYADESRALSELLGRSFDWPWST